LSDKISEVRTEDEPRREAPKPRRAPPVRSPAQDGGDERRAQLINAAEQVFLEKGYHAARMDDIAKTAAMSKKTIYQIFASKEELFEALVADRMMPTELTACHYDPTHSHEEILGEVMLDYVQWVLSPERLALLRLIMGEYAHSPELGRIVERQGRQRGVTILEKCLASLGATGKYEIEDPRVTAKMLIGMAIGNIYTEMLLGFSQPVAQATIRRRVERTVGIFLRGSRAGEAPIEPVPPGSCAH
jgi:TetR/AcrR family transcriptional repressor of mexJK operon